MQLTGANPLPLSLPLTASIHGMFRRQRGQERLKSARYIRTRVFGRQGPEVRILSPRPIFSRCHAAIPIAAFVLDAGL